MGKTWRQAPRRKERGIAEVQDRFHKVVEPVLRQRDISRESCPNGCRRSIRYCRCGWYDWGDFSFILDMLEIGQVPVIFYTEGGGWLSTIGDASSIEGVRTLLTQHPEMLPEEVQGRPLIARVWRIRELTLDGVTFNSAEELTDQILDLVEDWQVYAQTKCDRQREVMEAFERSFNAGN